MQRFNQHSKKEFNNDITAFGVTVCIILRFECIVIYILNVIFYSDLNDTEVAMQIAKQ